MPIRETLLFTIAGGGLLMDLLQEKVDNRLICLGFGSGLILDIFYSGFAGILHFFSGSFFPLLCLLPLFYFRMIGGGDIKLLSVLGGILGYPKVLSLLLLTFLTGAILSFAFLISCGVKYNPPVLIRLKIFRFTSSGVPGLIIVNVSSVSVILF